MESSTNLALEKAANELLSTISSAKDFVVEQAPDVFQQMIRWQIVSCVCMVCVFLVSLGLVFASARKTLRVSDDRVPPWLAITLCLGALCLCLFCVSAVETKKCLQALVSPKVFLLSEIKGLYR